MATTERANQRDAARAVYSIDHKGLSGVPRANRSSGVTFVLAKKSPQLIRGSFHDPVKTGQRNAEKAPSVVSRFGLKVEKMQRHTLSFGQLKKCLVQLPQCLRRVALFRSLKGVIHRSVADE